MAASKAMIETTIMISTKVKPWLYFFTLRTSSQDPIMGLHAMLKLWALEKSLLLREFIMTVTSALLLPTRKAYSLSLASRMDHFYILAFYSSNPSFSCQFTNKKPIPGLSTRRIGH